MPPSLHPSTSRLHWPGPGRVRVLSLPLHPAVILSSSSCVCVRLALALASSGVPPWHVVFVSSPLLLSSDLPSIALPLPPLLLLFVCSKHFVAHSRLCFVRYMHACVCLLLTPNPPSLPSSLHPVPSPAVSPLVPLCPTPCSRPSQIQSACFPRCVGIPLCSCFSFCIMYHVS